MIGGGPGAFIGAVHRMAARLDGQIELVCGCFSQHPTRSKETGQELFLQDDRIYDHYADMIRHEKSLPTSERMDFVSIVTPNHMHFEPAKLALESGFHVVLEKPMTFDLKEALELQKIVRQTDRQLCVTHTYSGYPMVKEAKQLIANNTLGKVRKIIVQYPQGWLSKPSESEENKQASWRTDPTRSGQSGAMGDIGTHAAHLAEYISGLKITQLCADLSIFVQGRQIDDDGNILLRFDNGAKGVLVASQVSAGEENALQINIYGEKGGLSWHQEHPNDLVLSLLDEPKRIIRPGNSYHKPWALSATASQNTRLPSGHPEGMIEAFANIYSNFAQTILHQAQKRDIPQEWQDFPSVDDGVRGMAFIEAVLKSNQTDQKWTDFGRY